jgi:hypothetical protein
MDGAEAAASLTVSTYQTRKDQGSRDAAKQLLAR